MQGDKYVIWVSQLYEINIKKLWLLLDHFGSATNMWHGQDQDYRKVDGITQKISNKIMASKKDFSPDDYLERLHQNKITFISYEDPAYPKEFKNMPDPPVGIYVRGRLPHESMIKVSVIGARKCSEYGMIMAYKLGKELAEKNIAVISGMARGLDSRAHEGCLANDGVTAAVLGCGVDVCYPPENDKLYRNLIRRGSIISEYPMGTTPKRGFFPARNRLIAAYSKATVVVEAGVKSGTLITVDQALDYGRDVYAVAGNATSGLSAGTNQLIKEGAPLVMSADDIISNLGIIENSHNMAPNNIRNILASKEKLVYDCMSLNPVNYDDIMARTGLDIISVQSILAILEIKKLVLRLPGQRFICSL